MTFEVEVEGRVEDRGGSPDRRTSGGSADRFAFCGGSADRFAFARPVREGVSTDSLKFHPGPPCPTLLHPFGGWPARRVGDLRPFSSPLDTPRRTGLAFAFGRFDRFVVRWIELPPATSQARPERLFTGPRWQNMTHGQTRFLQGVWWVHDPPKFSKGMHRNGICPAVWPPTGRIINN
jgi:hypothetical protein